MLIGGLLWIAYVCVLALMVAAAFWLFRFVVQPTRDLRQGRRTRGAALLLTCCVAALVAAIAAAFIGARLDGVAIVDLLMLRRIGSIDQLADPTALWPDRIVLVIFAAFAIAMTAAAALRNR